jgi:hypothetical protein
LGKEGGGSGRSDDSHNRRKLREMKNSKFDILWNNCDLIYGPEALGLLKIEQALPVASADAEVC